MKDVFNKIYTKNKWGFLSGVGSFAEFNHDYISFIKTYIKDNEIKSVVDLGSGDFRVSREIFLGNTCIDYTGIDCVESIINILSGIYKNEKNIHFKCLDFFDRMEEIPSADLFIIKDVLQHWPNSYVYTFLDYIIGSGKTKSIFVINSISKKEEDIYRIGDWRGLSACFMPLKKYKPKVIFSYKDKEVSIINCNVYT